MPGRAIRNSFLDRVKEGLKVPKACPFDCIKTCDVTHSPYCIMLALYNAFKGKLRNGYAFCGSNAWRAEKIQSVRELMTSLRTEYDSFAAKRRLLAPGKNSSARSDPPPPNKDKPLPAIWPGGVCLCRMSCVISPRRRRV